MSEITELRDAINNLRGSISSQSSGGGGGAVTTGIAAAAASGVIDAGLMNSAANAIKGELTAASKMITNILAGTATEMHVQLFQMSENMQQAITGVVNALAYFTSGLTGSTKLVGSARTAISDFDKEWNAHVMLQAGRVGTYRHRMQSQMAGLATPATENNAEEKKKKSNWLMDKFNGIIGKATLAISGFAAAGLAGTVEGYKLKTAFDRLAFQIADAMKPAIDALTWGVGKAGATLRDVNKNYPVARQAMGVAASALIGNAAIKFATGWSPMAATNRAGGWLTSKIPGAGRAAGTGIKALFDFFGGGMGAPKGLPWGGQGLNMGRAAAGTGAVASMVLAGEFEAFRGMQRTWEFNKAFRTMKMGKEGWYQPGVAAQQQDERQRAAIADPEKYKAQFKPEYQETADKNLATWREQYKGENDKTTWKKNYDEGKQGDSDHLSMMYSTNFSSVQSLWENMQKMSTENPGMDQQTSILQDIRDWCYGVDPNAKTNQPAAVGN